MIKKNVKMLCSELGCSVVIGYAKDGKLAYKYGEPIKSSDWVPSENYHKKKFEEYDAMYCKLHIEGK